MKKNVGILVLLLLLIPACGPKKKEVVTATFGKDKAHATKPVTPEKDKKSIFDDVEGFDLEDEANAFTPPAATEDIEEDVKIEEQDVVDDSWIEKRSEQAQEYGLKTIYFNFDEYDIRPDQQAAVEHDAKSIKALTEKGNSVVIEGHACRFAGSSAYNMMLSEKRAHAVKKHLEKQGVAGDKIKTVGRGYEMCLITEGDREAQAPNRRVEFFVLDDHKEVK